MTAASGASTIARMRCLSTLFAGLLFATVASAQADVATMVTELKREADDAEPELIQKIAKLKSREAMQGLIDAYEVMASVYMRREILRGLVRFDGVEDAEQPALDKIATVATSAKEKELREAAITALGRCETRGPHFLRRIITSAADDSVRELAMRAHIKRKSAADPDLYRKIWNPERERRKDADGNVEGELEAIRELAFKGIAPTLSDDELIATVKDEAELNKRIRRLALAELSSRRAPALAETATWVLERVTLPGQNRADAARILAASDRADALKTFLKLVKKKDVTQDDLRETIAEIIVEWDDEAANKQVAKLIGKGKPHEKVFALEATRHIDDPKVVKKIRRGLRDRDAVVREATASALASRRDRDSIPDLEKMLASPKAPEDMRYAIDAISEIRGTDPRWLTKLKDFTTSEDRDVRNAALERIGAARNRQLLPEVMAALKHDDWTTRLVAIKALEAWRLEEAMPELIERLTVETGRIKRLVANALWSLSGMPFDEDANQWQAWWKAEGAEFKVISEDKLEEAEKARELQRLKQRTTSDAEFFGIEIVSHRVIFVIDTSGSMTEPVFGRFVGKRAATRIDVAKEELAQCIERLDENALFNIFAFSSGIGRWLKSGIIGASEQARADALEWVERLGAGGATNLFDSLKLAFEDPDVDAIYVMSDGEPTSGEIIDPHRIRETVKGWNRHRGIEIHTIAIGGDLQVLEWLAEDSGGEHVRIR